jgi:hypothetical protein
MALGDLAHGLEKVTDGLGLRTQSRELECAKGEVIGTEDIDGPSEESPRRTPPPAPLTTQGRIVNEHRQV